jgi:hypothetical protein
MIPRLPLYNDVVTWEIERLKNNILQRLFPFLFNQATELSAHQESVNR